MTRACVNCRCKRKHLGHMDATRKVKNPLLFAAGHEYTDDFMSGNLIVPVTPATPAVLSDGEFLFNKICYWVGRKFVSSCFCFVDKQKFNFNFDYRFQIFVKMQKVGYFKCEIVFTI